MTATIRQCAVYALLLLSILLTQACNHDSPAGPTPTNPEPDPTDTPAVNTLTYRITDSITFNSGGYVDSAMQYHSYSYLDSFTTDFTEQIDTGRTTDGERYCLTRTDSLSWQSGLSGYYGSGYPGYPGATVLVQIQVDRVSIQVQFPSGNNQNRGYTLLGNRL